ncbi:MAG: bacterial transcriptional activator domain-containing protein [Anaerolineaceae bacterium]|nr:bacterial transcriptional activator domain-containing protein [Anaerolineaceae bacterium]
MGRILQYEENLITFTQGLDHYYQKEYSKALKYFLETLNFFLSNQYKALLGKNCLYTLLTYLQLGNNEEIKNISELLKKNLLIPENQFVLLPTGLREYKQIINLINQYQDTKYLKQWLALVDSYQKRIPVLRRRIRRKTTLVPFAPARLEIITLGDMKVKFNEQWLTSSDWQTQSARDFFFLILSKPQGLTKEEIGLLLWPEDSEQELKFHFKNAIYRVRHAIGKDTVLLEGERYVFNKNMDFRFDAGDFRREVVAIQKATKWEEIFKLYKSLLKLYKGPYLPDMDAKWIRQERTELHELFLQILEEISKAAFEQENFPISIEISQEILKNDPCKEEAYRTAMRAQAASGNRMEVERLYKLCEKHLLDELEAPPSQKTRKLHQALMKF